MSLVNYRFGMSVCILFFMSLVISGPAWAQWENPSVDTITNTQIRKETVLQSLDLDSLGMVHLTWKQQSTPGWRIFYSTNSPGGSWTTPEEVGDSAQPSFAPALALRPGTDDPKILLEQSEEIIYAYLANSAWQRQPITNNAQLDCDPTIAVDASGTVHAAWITDDPGSGQYKIAYALGDTLGWDIQTLSGSNLGPFGTGASPFIAVSAEGNAHIVYRGGDYGDYHIHHAWNDTPGDTIWNYEMFYSGNVNDFSAMIVIEENGDCHLALSGNDGWGFPGRVFYFHKPDGQPWQQYELASGSGSAAEPSLSVDESGTPHIVWMETSGNFYTGNIFYSGRDTAGIWATSLVIGSDFFLPSFDIDQQGYGHVACFTGGNTAIYDIYHVKSSGVLTGVDEITKSLVTEPARSFLWSFPNPVRDHAAITYYTPVSSHVALSVYDSQGQEVEMLVDEFNRAGTHTVLWRVAGLSSGVYFYRLIAGTYERTRKCVVLK